ncbi:hypothetical protein F511_26831 [Dorcoceras hygrometricum]|uniref:Uncharacterized protein n=1 Tax=Dorcoceras hygrometricum TaxID=472368 RepID=A0A2Z7CSM5_9LAMI|nr:hypothetical protein F511_26831 [Dorcoceras hygrometricum]
MLGECIGFLYILVFRTALDSCGVLLGSRQTWRVEKYWLVTSDLALVDASIFDLSSALLVVYIDLSYDALGRKLDKLE